MKAPVTAPQASPRWAIPPPKGWDDSERGLPVQAEVPAERGEDRLGTAESFLEQGGRVVRFLSWRLLTSGRALGPARLPVSRIVAEHVPRALERGLA